MTTVREVVQKIYDGSMTVDQAEKKLKGVQGTRARSLTWDENQLGEDIDPGDENDVTQISVLTLAGKISYDDADRLYRALTPPQS
jgi:hypothetical protein